MQQLYSTTEAENEHVALVAYALGDAIILTPEQAEQTAETSQTEQEQAALRERLLAALERDTQRRRKWNAATSGVCFVGAMAFWIVWGVTWLVSRRYAGILLDHFTWFFV